MPQNQTGNQNQAGDQNNGQTQRKKKSSRLLLLGPVALTGVALVVWMIQHQKGKTAINPSSDFSGQLSGTASGNLSANSANPPESAGAAHSESLPQPIITSGAIGLRSITEESQRLLQGQQPAQLSNPALSQGQTAPSTLGAAPHGGSGAPAASAPAAAKAGASVGVPALGGGSLPSVGQQASGRGSVANEPQAKAAAPLSGCFTVSYSHQKIASHSDGHACLSHPNSLTLQLPSQLQAGAKLAGKINPKSVCVLVNDEPVKWKFQQDGNLEVATFGPGAGPDATVKARFCVNQSVCNDPCVIKKDDFMAALGLDESEGGAAVGWDGTQGSSHEEQELDKRVQALNQDRGAKGEASLFKGWTAEAFTTGCSKGMATAPVAPQAKSTLLAKAPKAEHKKHTRR